MILLSIVSWVSLHVGGEVLHWKQWRETMLFRQLLSPSFSLTSIMSNILGKDFSEYKKIYKANPTNQAYQNIKS